MSFAIMTAPSGDLPIETTDAEKKIAAADAAQVTANTAQAMADEYKKAAEEALTATDEQHPLTDTQSVRVQLAEATQHAIRLLRKVNGSNQ